MAGIQPVNFIYEEYVALFQICKQRRQIARLRDDGAGSHLEIHAQFARHDLGKRCFAKSRRPGEKHMIEGIASASRGIDEHLQICARLRLADEFRQPLRAERKFSSVLVLLFRSIKRDAMREH